MLEQAADIMTVLAAIVATVVLAAAVAAADAGTAVVADVVADPVAGVAATVVLAAAAAIAAIAKDKPGIQERRSSTLRLFFLLTYAITTVISRVETCRCTRLLSPSRYLLRRT
jgi:NADH:ubiquinone oxidoreductase subunit 2 (subunit N)